MRYVKHNEIRKHRVIEPCLYGYAPLYRALFPAASPGSAVLARPSGRNVPVPPPCLLPNNAGVSGYLLRVVLKTKNFLALFSQFSIFRASIERPLPGNAQRGRHVLSLPQSLQALQPVEGAGERPLVGSLVAQDAVEVLFPRQGVVRSHLESIAKLAMVLLQIAC